MNFFEDVYKKSETKEFSKLNKLTIKFQLVEVFLLPILMIFLSTIVHPIIDRSSPVIYELSWGVPIWIGSIISFGCGAVSIYLAVKGIKHSLGKKMIFIINLIIGLFGLFMLFFTTFFPQVYIIFDRF